ARSRPARAALGSRVTPAADGPERMLVRTLCTDADVPAGLQAQFASQPQALANFELTRFIAAVRDLQLIDRIRDDRQKSSSWRPKLRRHADSRWRDRPPKKELIPDPARAICPRLE